MLRAPAARLDSQGLTVTHAQRSGVAATALLALAAAASAVAAPPVAQPVPVRHSADASFARLEHEYVTYVLERFPVVATYLGGAQFDPHLAAVDGTLRDYSAAALQQRGRARSARFRAQLRGARAGDAVGAPAHRPLRRPGPDRLPAAPAPGAAPTSSAALDSYVDEPFRGVDWQIQGMTATGAATYGTDGGVAGGDRAHARRPRLSCRAPSSSCAAGVAAHDTRRTGACCVSYGLQQHAPPTPSTSPRRCRRSPPADIAAPRRARAAARPAGGRRRGRRRLPAPARLRRRHLLRRRARGGRAQALQARVPRRPLRLRRGRVRLGAAQQPARERHAPRELFSASLADRARRTRARDDRARASRSPPRTAGRTVPSGAQTVRAVFEQLQPERAAQRRRDGRGLPQDRRSAWWPTRARTGLFDVPADYRLDVAVTPPPLRASIEGAAYYPAPPFKKSRRRPLLRHADRR